MQVVQAHLLLSACSARARPCVQARPCAGSCADVKGGLGIDDCTVCQALYEEASLSPTLQCNCQPPPLTMDCVIGCKATSPALAVLPTRPARATRCSADGEACACQYYKASDEGVTLHSSPMPVLPQQWDAPVSYTSKCHTHNIGHVVGARQLHAILFFQCHQGNQLGCRAGPARLASCRCTMRAQVQPTAVLITPSSIGDNDTSTACELGGAQHRGPGV